MSSDQKKPQVFSETESLSVDIPNSREIVREYFFKQAI